MVYLSWLLGNAKTAFTHHASPVKLVTKEGVQISLLDLAKEEIPPCRLNPLLFNGHLQTMWTAVKEAGPPIYYKRKIFQSDFQLYGGQFVVDFVVPPPEKEEVDETLPERTTYYSERELSEMASDDDRPMLVCLHGLSGGSHEVYLRQAIAPLTAVGWEACVVTARGCAMSKITTSELFNARATWDVRQTVKWLKESFPNRPLYGVGFSIGANIITNYIAEEGEDCHFRAAVACSNPWNLEVSHHNIQRTWVGHEIYSKTLGTNVRNLYYTHKEQILKNPKIDHQKAESIKHLFEFDRYIQAPTWGYPTEMAYYRDASSADSVVAIKIPFLSINATDDPISANEAIPYGEFEQNPYTILCTTDWGGHLSWFQLGGKRWFATALSNFLMKFHNDIDPEASSKQHEKANGFVASPKKYPIFDPTNRRMIFP